MLPLPELLLEIDGLPEGADLLSVVVVLDPNFGQKDY